MAMRSCNLQYGHGQAFVRATSYALPPVATSRSGAHLFPLDVRGYKLHARRCIPFLFHAGDYVILSMTNEEDIAACVRWQAFTEDSGRISYTTES